MKNLIMILSLLLISSLAFSQRPEVVDNSQYFPPYKGQLNNFNCSHFALVYYLKSSIWNREFDRNPKLEENQFSHPYVWNQNVNSAIPRSFHQGAFRLIKHIGCATVADFPIDEMNTTLMPDFKTKEKGLSFKSKALIKSLPAWNHLLTNEQNKKIFVKELKDSLIDGKNFVISFRMYEEYINELDSGEVYNYLDKYSDRTLWNAAHMATVAGYNDTIKTANGRGAFMVINSSTKSPLFYLDYQWIIEGRSYWGIYFLKEDFSSKPELALHLSLENSLDNLDSHKKDYIFVDNLQKKEDVMVDYHKYWEYQTRPNLARIVRLNGKRIPIDSLEILFPIANVDGKFDVIADLTEIVSKEDFESVEIVVNDPIAAEFSSDEDGIIYSYKRESQVQVVKSFVSIIGSDSTAIGEVTDLPDTTIIFNDFYSLQAGFHVDREKTYDEFANNGIYVNTAKSVLARKLITIRKEDFKLPLELKSSLDTLVAYEDSVATFQYEIESQEDEVSYDLVLNNGASITSTGLFTFSADGITVTETEWHDFIVEITSGDYTLRDTFVVELRPSISSTSVKERYKPNFSLLAYPNPVKDRVNFEFNLPDRGMVNIEVYNLSGQLIEIAVSDYFESGYNSASFNSSYLKPGTYLCRLRDENNLVQTIKIIKR